MRTATKKQKRKLVFLSHSSRDTWVAQQIAAHLRKCGVDVFLDAEKIEGGDDFDRAIRTALQRAAEFLVLLTPWALKRPYIWMELGVAWSRKIRFVGVLHGVSPKELRAHGGVPQFLNASHLLELNDLPRYLRELKKRI